MMTKIRVKKLMEKKTENFDLKKVPSSRLSKNIEIFSKKQYVFDSPDLFSQQQIV